MIDFIFKEMSAHKFVVLFLGYVIVKGLCWFLSFVTDLKNRILYEIEIIQRVIRSSSIFE